MLLKRMCGRNEMKILWFAISYAFEKDVWYKWYENTLVCNFLPFQKDVWDKSNENAWICDFLHFYKGCMG